MSEKQENTDKKVRKPKRNCQKKPLNCLKIIENVENLQNTNQNVKNSQNIYQNVEKPLNPSKNH